MYKNSIRILIFLSFFSVFSQQKGINLINMKSKDTIFLMENKRIKIDTKDGEHLAGKFTVVNDSTISIKNKIIAIDSIVKIRKASVLSTIIIPITVTIGAVFLTAGIAGAIAGSWGYFATIVFVPPGLPLFIVPQTANKHNVKRWKYEIKYLKTQNNEKIN
jgi:hypothetical protein